MSAPHQIIVLVLVFLFLYYVWNLFYQIGNFIISLSNIPDYSEGTTIWRFDNPRSLSLFDAKTFYIDCAELKHNFETASTTNFRDYTQSLGGVCVKPNGPYAKWGAYNSKNLLVSPAGKELIFISSDNVIYRPNPIDHSGESQGRIVNVPDRPSEIRGSGRVTWFINALENVVVIPIERVLGIIGIRVDAPKNSQIATGLGFVLLALAYLDKTEVKWKDFSFR
jgi:hypothetical protein